MTAVVELRKIGKQFPGVRALHDVSLSIEPGEVLGLVGENGAGKSTLIKILGGVYGVGSYRGDVVVAGRVRSFRSTREARSAGIAIVHQELALVPDMSIADNLVLGREPVRFGVVDAARAQQIARQMLRDVLGGEADAIDLDQPVHQLGVGVQQILEIARALADDAKVVVLDEPTAALTDAETERLFQLVRARRAAGTSFVYISHRLEEIAALCDRVAVLRDGELVGVNSAPFANDDVVVMMTGKEMEPPRRQERQALKRISSSDPGELGVLAVKHLRVAHPSLPGRFVVDGLSFEVHAGEVLALAGAMGSGRTATLSALFGAARSAVTGEIRVDGKLVTIRDPRDAIAAGLALVPEDRKGQGLVLGASVADNLALASTRELSRAGFFDAARAESRAHALSRDLSIKAPGLGAEVATLSGGNQQKVVIGKWLERAPRVLLLDEPTRGVDIGAKAELYALVEQLVANGAAVVLASSDLPEVVRLADRVLVLREGKLAGELVRPHVSALAIMQHAVGSVPANQEVAREARA
ncbi:MAG: sugar ABC transporter ATP-binding protein [Acidobacteriota bacterium]